MYKQTLKGLTKSERAHALLDIGMTDAEWGAIENPPHAAMPLGLIAEELNDEEREALLVRNSPFWDAWTRKQLKKFSGCQNERTQDGDYLCPFCMQRILNPTETNTINLSKSKTAKKFIIHGDCVLAEQIEDETLQDLLDLEAEDPEELTEAGLPADEQSAMERAGMAIDQGSLNGALPTSNEPADKQNENDLIDT